MNFQIKIINNEIEYLFTKLEFGFFKSYESPQGYFIQHSYKNEKSFLLAIKKMENKNLK